MNRYNILGILSGLLLQEYVDPQYWQRYENFLAGQAVFGQNLGVKGPRVDYHDSYNNGKDKHHLDLI